MISTPERANEWRSESLKEHDIDVILDEGFGYFIRYTLECRERLFVYKMFRKFGVSLQEKDVLMSHIITKIFITKILVIN